MCNKVTSHHRNASSISSTILMTGRRSMSSRAPARRDPVVSDFTDLHMGKIKLRIHFSHPNEKVASSPGEPGLSLGARLDWPKKAPCLMRNSPCLRRLSLKWVRGIYEGFGGLGKIFYKVAKCLEVGKKAAFRKRIFERQRARREVGPIGRGAVPPRCGCLANR